MKKILLIAAIAVAAMSCCKKANCQQDKCCDKPVTECCQKAACPMADSCQAQCPDAKPCCKKAEGECPKADCEKKAECCKKAECPKKAECCKKAEACKAQCPEAAAETPATPAE